MSSLRSYLKDRFDPYRRSHGGVPTSSITPSVNESQENVIDAPARSSLHTPTLRYSGSLVQKSDSKTYISSAPPTPPVSLISAPRPSRFVLAAECIVASTNALLLPILHDPIFQVPTPPASTISALDKSPPSALVGGGSAPPTPPQPVSAPLVPVSEELVPPVPQLSTPTALVQGPEPAVSIAKTLAPIVPTVETPVPLVPMVLTIEAPGPLVPVVPTFETPVQVPTTIALAPPVSTVPSVKVPVPSVAIAKIPTPPVPTVEAPAPPVFIINTPKNPVSTTKALAPVSTGNSSRDAEEPFGLKVVVEGINPEVDLVAVHGLDGHWEDTWTAENGFFWLCDLHKIVPNVRVLTWGYDGRTHGSKTFSCQSFHDHALTLVTDLSTLRKATNTQERPIIFIAHSVGGIIVKDALIHSHSTNKSNLEHHNAIKTSTCGVMFFGTPHQGTDTISWPKILFKITRNKNEALLKELEGNSASLQKQLAQYNHISSHFETKFFYETYKSAGGDFLVPQGAAVVPGATNAETLAIHSNHEGLVKYKGTNDVGFRKVSQHISFMVDDAPAKALENWQRRRLVAAAEENEGVLMTFEIPFELEYLRNHRFTGRQSLLDEIHAKVEDNNTSSQSTPIVLHGTGGIGKSQVVVEYLYTHQHERSSIFWINSATNETITLGFRAAAQRLIKQHAKISLKDQPHYPTIAKSLGMVGVVDENSSLLPGAGHNECIVNGMKLWFSRPENRNWLLVFDNVDDVETLRIETFMPSPAAGTIIMTSRRPECADFGVGIEVKEMSAQEGVGLLLRTINSGNQGDDPIALAITKAVGSLPLALAQAGAYIATRRVSLKEYLEIYKESFNQAFAKKPLPGVWTYEDRSILTTWEISFQAIREASEDAAELLSLCSFLFNEVPKDMLSRGRMAKAGDFTLDDSLDLLYSYSLAQPQTTDGSFYIHPVVHRWAHERLRHNKRAQKVQEAVILVTSVLRSTEHKTLEDWKYERSIIAHIDSVTKNARAYLCGTIRIDSLTDPMQSLLIVNFEWRRVNEVEWIASQVNEASRAAKGGHHTDTASAMGNLANTYTNQGRWDKAEKLGLQVMEARKRSLGLEHPDTLSAIGNLANTYTNQGRLDEAEKLQLQVMEARKKSLGLGHPDTLSAMENLATTYTNQGRWDKAEKLQLQVMEARKKSFGLEHPGTLSAMGNLATTYTNQGQWDEAEKLGLQVMEARKRILGLEHPDTLSAMEKLAITHGLQCKFNESYELLLKAADGRERTLGKDHPDTIRIKVLLPKLQQLQPNGEGFGAETLTAMENQGNDYLDALAAMSKQAGIYMRQGLTQEAEQLLQQVKEGREKTLGSEHPDTLSAIASLASVYWAQKRWDEAENLQQQVLDTRQRVLGNGHPDTLSAMSSLASTYWGQEWWEKAEDLEQQVVEVRQSVLGIEHPDTLSAIASLAVSYRMQGQYAKAGELHRQVMEND